MNFEMANSDDPERIIKGTQSALISAMREVISDMEKEPACGPGLTWKQIQYFLSEFEKKKVTIVYQQEEL